VWQDNAWKKVASATTIGYKRIVKLEPVETSKVRVKIIAAKACPLISQIGLY
jgi:alpha-L-fucosidase